MEENVPYLLQFTVWPSIIKLLKSSTKEHMSNGNENDDKEKISVGLVILVIVLVALALWGLWAVMKYSCKLSTLGFWSVYATFLITGPILPLIIIYASGVTNLPEWHTYHKTRAKPLLE